MITDARRFPVVYCLLLAGLITASLFRFNAIAPPNPQTLGNAGYRALWDGDPSAAVGRFEEAVRADPAFPYRWSDLGEAYAAAGRIADASQCFERALEIAPHSALIALRAANFYFSTGRAEQGLRLDNAILRQTSELDETVFRTDLRFGGPLNQILDAGIGDNPRAARAFFTFLLPTAKREQLDQIWRFMVSHNDPDAAITRVWAGWLLHSGSASEAVNIWAEAPLDPGWRKSNWVDNGSFEAQAAPGGAFDWSSNPAVGVTPAIDVQIAHSGARSLRLTVDSAENLDYHGYSERVWLEPGAWRLEGWIRTRDFSTDRGIGLAVIDPQRPSELSAFTPDLTGTRDWTQMAATFTVSGAPRLVEVRVVRRPTWDFDNHPRGIAWVDDVAIRKLPDDVTLRGLR